MPAPIAPAPITAAWRIESASTSAPTLGSLFGPFAQEEEPHQLARHRTFAQAGVGFADEPQLFLVALTDAALAGR